MNDNDEVMAKCDCGLRAKVGAKTEITDPPSKCERQEGCGCRKLRAAISAAHRRLRSVRRRASDG